MKEPEPIIVANLFPEALESLLQLLRSLGPDDWSNATVCRGWTVKDIAAHLLGGDVGILSRKRDAYRFDASSYPNDLAKLINSLNAEWVAATRRVSPYLLCELLSFAGPQVSEYFASLDAFALGEPVSWAGPEPAPVWLDLAREYTERWHHQQQIRDAVGMPGLKEPQYFRPVLEAFAYALPQTYLNISSPQGTVIAFECIGDVQTIWSVKRVDNKWKLFSGDSSDAEARIVIQDDLAWRLFTKGLTADAVKERVRIEGDQSLGLSALDTVAVIA